MKYFLLRTELLRADLAVEVLDRLVFKYDDHPDTVDLAYIQLHPLLKMRDHLYLNGSLLFESFLSYIDTLFKTPSFRDFKGHILERYIAGILQEYGLAAYNIIFSNHPAADHNPKFQALLKRTSTSLDPRYEHIYPTPGLLHAKFTNAPFFQQ